MKLKITKVPGQHLIENRLNKFSESYGYSNKNLNQPKKIIILMLNFVLQKKLWYNKTCLIKEVNKIKININQKKY